MVMRLHLEHRDRAVSDIPRAGVLPRPLDDPLACRRQSLQMHTRALVGAMLAPHHREHPQLSEVRLPPEDLDDLLVLLVREVVLRDEVFGGYSLSHGCNG